MLQIAGKGFQGLFQSTGCFFAWALKEDFLTKQEKAIFLQIYVSMLCKAC